MRFLVTGCAGFIGSSISEELLRKGNFVLGIDNLDNLLYPSNIKKSRIGKLTTYDNFVFKKMNILDNSATRVIKKFNPYCIINEAGLPGQILSWSNLNAYSKSNLESAYKLGQIAKELEVQKFIQASTSSVYGSIVSGDENLNTNPNSPYGITKLAAEHALKNVFNDTATSLTVLRYFSVYGPNQRPDMGLHRFIRCALNGKPIDVYGDGSQSRDFTFIDDVVSATILAVDEKSNSSVFNISGGEQKSVLEVLNLIENYIQKPLNIRFVKKPMGDQISTFAETSEAKKKLNWSPKVAFDTGLRLQFDWQSQH